MRFLNRHAVDPTLMTGKFTKFTDRNGDGDFDDEGEAERWFSHLFSHNALQTSATRRNKVSSPSDVLLHRDERVFVTMDGCGRQTGEVIPFIPGDAKAVRVDSETGRFADEITGLTTAVDVAMDDRGNIFVVGMAYADLLPKLFNLFDPDAPPLHSSYLRLSGGVTLYPATRAIPPRLLVEGLDMPTNITLGLACPVR